MDTDNADLEFWLAKWASWMRWNLDEYPQGDRPVASGFENARTNWMVSENDAADYWDLHAVPVMVRAVDSAIDSLPPDDRRVVWWRYGLTKLEPTCAPLVFAEVFERVKVLVLKRVAIA